MMFNAQQAAAKRLGVPILAYVGANGSGKSLLAVSDCAESLENGRRVLSSVRLTVPDDDQPCTDPTCEGWASHPDHRAAHPLWSPLRTWQDFLEAEHCDVLLDEITGIASSRESAALPGVVSDRLMQLRRRDIVLRWTAPSWARADLLLREVTQAVVMCRGMVRRRAVGQMWPASTVIWSKMVDARDLDELTQSQRLGTSQTRLTVLGRGMQRVRNTKGANYYHTLDTVSSLAATRPRGTCLTCTGRVVQPQCKCAGGTAAAEPARLPTPSIRTVR